MTECMIQVVSMSLRAVLIIGVVFAVRALFSLAHISKKYVMLLWVLPFFFLVFPWKVTVPKGFWSTQDADVWQGISGLGWKDWLEWIYEAGQANEEGAAGTAKSFLDADAEPDSQYAFHPAGADANTKKTLELQRAEEADGGFAALWNTLAESPADTVALIWAAGVFLFLMHGAFAYWKLKRSVLCSVPSPCMEQGSRLKIYITDGILTPIVMGCFKPCIYLPASMDEGYRDYVVAHEKAHIRRKDYLTKPAAYLIVCLHWFHPAVWAAWFFMAKDMEMACDEEAISELGIGKRKDYASALLALSAGGSHLSAIPPAFGKGDMKMRIQNIMHYKKATKKAAVAAALGVAVLAGVFLTAEEQNAAPTAGAPVEADKEQDAEHAAHMNQQTLTFQMVREAFAGKTAGQMDFLSYTNSTKEVFDENAENYNLDFYFAYGNEEYRFSVSCDKHTDLLENIYITRVSDMQTAWIYTADQEEGEQYPNSLEDFLRTKTKISDWLTAELPKGYTLGDYRGDLGGALIAPQVYETKGESASAPEYWKYAGFIAKIDAAQDVFVFQDGGLDKNFYPRSNHSMEEAVGVLDTIVPGAGWKTLLVHGYHDLYTGAELGELEMEGEDLAALETQSEYWYFYFVKEGEEEAYVLSLSAKAFTRDEAESIAGTAIIHK
ncbi:MAG: M56 family metallopeptidase [Eubacterium sp.]|nr:M56 family metallopeptidase [Eubacterium sp.]